MCSDKDSNTRIGRLMERGTTSPPRTRRCWARRAGRRRVRSSPASTRGSCGGGSRMCQGTPRSRATGGRLNRKSCDRGHNILWRKQGVALTAHRSGQNPGILSGRLAFWRERFMDRRFGELSLYNPFITSFRIPTTRKTKTTDVVEDLRGRGGSN